MKLQALAVGETGVGMMQIQSQLSNLMLQIQYIKKGDEMKEVGCTRCRIEGHHKDSCPTFLKYLASGALKLGVEFAIQEVIDRRNACIYKR